MQKYILSSGNILKVKKEENKREFIIDNAIGEGATCVVYSAHIFCDEVKRNVRIKELYPKECKIKRMNDELIWEVEEERKAQFEDFRRIYRQHIQIQNCPTFINTTAHIIDELWESNNTLYMVIDIDDGKTFDEESRKDLKWVFSSSDD